MIHFDWTLHPSDLLIGLGLIYVFWSRLQDVPAMKEGIESLKDTVGDLRLSLAELATEFRTYRSLRNGNSQHK